MSLANKVVVVTGGAGLIGGEFCRAISQHGGVAVIADSNIVAAKEVAETIRNINGKAEAVQLDITRTESVESLIDSVSLRFGRIDAVVNNAFPRNERWGGSLEEVTYADFCEHLSMHLGGYFLVAQKFALHFRENGGGNIVNMGSIYGVIPPRFEVYAGTNMTSAVEYAAIKGGILHLTRYFAQYFKSDKVRCNSLSPGGVFDHQDDAFLDQYAKKCGTKGMLDASDLIGSLIYLLSEDSRYMTGQNLVVDDGFSL